MAAGAALLGVLLSFWSGAAHAAGCSQAPGCPYVDVGVLGREPPTGQGVLRFPQAITFSPGGSYVFVADQYSGLVQKFDRQGNWVSQLGWYADKGQLGRFGVIGGLATDLNHHLYVLDSQYDRVQVFRSDNGAWVGAWGSRGALTGLFNLGVNAGAGGIAIHQPAAADPPLAFIADQNNNRIERFTLDHFSTADSSGPILPAGSADAVEPNYVPAPDPPLAWGSYGDCTPPPGCGQQGDRYLLNYPQGIAVNPVPDASNRTLVYVADDLNQRVIEFTTNGTYVGEVGGFGSAPGQFSFPHDVAVDAAGNLFVADYGNHRVERFDAFNLSFKSAWGGVDLGPTQLEAPRALAAPTDGSFDGVYVADSSNHRVRGFASDGSLTASWGTAGRGGPGYVTRPGGLAVDRTGNLYIADTWAHRVEKLSSVGAYLGQWGHIIERTAFATTGIDAGQFRFPRGVAYDPAGGNLWVADTTNNRVQGFTTAGAWLATYGGTAPGSGLGSFNTPKAIAVGPAGELYVADTGNNRIQRRDPSGAWSRVEVGTQLDTPSAVAVDGSGTLFVGDRAHVLRIENGTATQIDPPSGSFDRPGGLWVTGNRLYVSDTGNSRVLRLDRPSGTWVEIGGEGPGLGSFVGPTALVTSPDGRTLFVADQYNNRIQRFVLELPQRSSGRQAVTPTSRTTPARDRVRPKLRLRARLRQRALKRGAVLISINCTERCLAAAAGRIEIRHLRRGLALRGVKRQLMPGVRVTLALKIPKKARRKVSRALKQRRRVTAIVIVTARDFAGNTGKDSRRIRIRP
jgi:DNA-binding beta-propeller fold protein YncE